MEGMKIKRMLKRILSCMLVAAMAVPAAMPTNSLAKTGNNL